MENDKFIEILQQIYEQQIETLKNIYHTRILETIAKGLEPASKLFKTSQAILPQIIHLLPF